MLPLASTSNEELEDFHCKIVLVGDCKCGKTALIHQFVNDEFLQVYAPTIFERYSITYKVTNYRVHCTIWDTSGFEASALQRNYIAKCRRRLFNWKPDSNEASINLINDLLWNRDFCENVTTSRSEFSNVDIAHTPEMLQNPHLRIRHAGASKPGSGEAGANRRSSGISNDPGPVIIEPVRRPFYHNFWSMLKNAFGVFSGTHRIGHQISVLESVPQNTVSNLLKMIFLPILLIVIAVAMVPSIKELSRQTFYSIFYNAKLPDSRIASLKRISVGISLIFEHMVKKMFPVVRLRWMNRKLFKRREQILAPIPPAVPSLG